MNTTVVDQLLGGRIDLSKVRYCQTAGAAVEATKDWYNVLRSCEIGSDRHDGNGTCGVVDCS